MRPQIEISDIQKYFDEFMYGFDASIFAYAWNNKQNVLLFGPGGHGKSEAAMLFFKYLISKGIYSKEDVPFVQSFNPEITTEKILGGIDIKKFTAEGSISYNYQDSFLNYKFVVFEEIFDATKSALLFLKDVLTSGFHRDGNKIYPLKCDIVIGITNVNPEDFAEDNSSQALLERFPYQTEIKWNSYTEDDYLEMYKKVFKNEPSTIVKVVANAAAATYNPQEGRIPVSPRTFIKAVSSCENCKTNQLNPLLFMNYPGGFSKEAVKSAIINYNSIVIDNQERDEIERYRKEFNELSSCFKLTYDKILTSQNNVNEILDAYEIVKKVYKKYADLSALKVRDTNTLLHKELIIKAKEYYKKASQTLQQVIPDNISNYKLLEFKNTEISKYEW